MQRKQAVLFTKNRKIKEYKLTIKGKKIITGPSAKYLGITLDKFLDFIGV